MPIREQPAADRNQKSKGGFYMDEKIMKLQELIDQHDNIVFFGGAGVSTESGIPDFRSQTDYIIRNMIILRRLS